MRILKSEKGISLVELISAMALLSLVAVLIMTTLSIGIKHSIVESDKTQIQQEANLVVSKLLNGHRQGDCYFIRDKDAIIQMATFDCSNTLINEANASFTNISSSNYQATLSTNSLFIAPSTVTTPAYRIAKVNPTSNDFNLVAKLTRVGKVKINYQINTTLTRYKTNN
jgi:type II secretory pathway pseudopilin PulG